MKLIQLMKGQELFGRSLDTILKLHDVMGQVHEEVLMQKRPKKGKLTMVQIESDVVQTLKFSLLMSQ
jgi:hypothetical protein